jgi:uncharacterized damage-inducible protein DinB
MTIKDYLLAQLDREATLTRKAIERFPEGHNDFKPHERSMEFGYLASLVAAMPGWIPFIVDRDELDLDDPSSESLRTKPLGTKAEMLDRLDSGVANARRSLEATNDEHLDAPWGFKMRGIEFPKWPRHVAIADTVFSHLAHHRGQLTVYLRLNGAAVPALYGPSADERA